ncbi:hypothetical protein GCM10022419_061140 [Nonomuraea rosea]|uniref:Uncharacterized protein n=1 Tax=Nonomuraea rosea TaxID=638574 RepID=A0ABP6XSX1_9ACTN
MSEMFPSGPDTGFHIAWSALASLGVGMLLRWRGPARLLGFMPLVLVAGAHAAHNFDVARTARSTVGDALAQPFVAVEPLLGLWPFLALAFAIWSDSRALRRGKVASPQLLLAGERPTALSSLATVGRYALIRPPCTAMVAHRYVLLRRTAWYAGRAAERDLASAACAKMQASPTFISWRGVGLRAGLSQRLSGRGRRGPWMLLIWAVLALPVLAYFVLGATPELADVQRALAGPVVFPLLLALSGVGLALVIWHLAIAVRSLALAWRDTLTERATRVQLRLLAGTGTLLLGAVTLTSWLRGARPDQHVISNAHVLNALNDLLLYGGLALLLAGFVLFPPAGLIGLAGGGLVAVPTITTGFITLEALGFTGILLSQATPEQGGDNGESGGGSPSAAEQARLHDLGVDPATGQFRPVEMETAQRIEQQLGLTLTRSKHVGADWLDSKGVTYDAVGNFPSQFFDRQRPRLQQAILDHLQKVDLVPVDVSKFTPGQVAKVQQFIQNLGPRVFLVGA